MSDCKEVLLHLKSDNVEEVREAAFVAGEEKCIETVPILATLLESENLGIQEAVDLALRRIGGKDVVDAVTPLLRSDDPPTRNLSMDILREVGVQDLPSLVKLLHDDDPDVRIFASDILGSTENLLAVEPLCHALLHDPEVNVRYQAAVSLGELALPQAAKCLNKALKDEEWVQFAVIEAISKIRDESSVSALVTSLSSCTDLVASMIVEALGEIGNIKAVTMLIRKLDESPTALRNKIVEAVVKIMGGKSLKLLSLAEREKFREYLLVALSDEDTEIQDAAIDGLGFVGGEKASAAVLRLAAVMNAELESERIERSILSLTMIGLTPALEEALKTHDQQRAMVAIEVLSRLDEPTVPQLLMESFEENDLEVKRVIAAALYKVGGEDSIAFFSNLLSLDTDPDTIKTALAFVGEKMRSSDNGQIVYSMLEHPEDEVKEAALEACVAIDGPDMVERFRALFGSEDPLSRLMAVYALGKLGAKENMDELKAALGDEIPDIRKIALEAIADACPDSEEAMNLVLDRLYDENRDVRLAVVDKIGQCSLGQAIQYLVQALEDPDDWVKIRAMEALAVQEAGEAVPRLIGLLEDENKLLALKVVETLGNIGGESAFRALLDLVGKDDPELSDAAEDAIARIQEDKGMGA
ncbi:HEAT repeat domain-containing protein [Desulfovibrio inopinatus]|uniref:HEAT repeat domain-containing protein n=1 Tax=Desulfovibrio inopinatus TaxID=102109 RepID=UPI000415AAE7|nr:HEAT repeat domain-containing protein [Desulfovibrio inopinatus]